MVYACWGVKLLHSTHAKRSTQNVHPSLGRFVDVDGKGKEVEMFGVDIPIQLFYACLSFVWRELGIWLLAFFAINFAEHFQSFTCKSFNGLPM